MTSGEWWEKIPDFTYNVLNEGCNIFGCHIIKLDKFDDTRGYLSVLAPDGIDDLVYAYYSVTPPNAARDIDTWHVHCKHTDRFIVLRGDAIVALSDGECVYNVILSEHLCQMLVILPGVYHCFRPLMFMVGLINFPTLPYDPEDEGRVKFSDLDVVHPW